MSISNSEKKRDTLIAIGIFIIALGIRVINLGQFLTTDEPEGWLGKSIKFIQAILEGQLSDTFLHYSPGVTLMWSGSFGLYLAYLFNPDQASGFTEFLQTFPFDPIAPNIIFWFRLPNVIIGAICTAVGYLFAKKLLGLNVALLGAILLALDPLFIGMNRLLGHDGLATSFMLVSTLAAIYFFTGQQQVSLWILILSATSAGLAILAKSTAFYLFPFIGFIVFATIFWSKPNKPKIYIWNLLLWGAVVTTTFFILWPALWVQPIQTIQNMLDGLSSATAQPHNRGSFFWGQPVPDPGTWFYWLAAYFRLTAITTIGLLLGIIYFFSKDIRNQNSSPFNKQFIIFLLGAFIIFYLIFLSFGSKKQDRYIVPILPMVSFVAAAGYSWLAEKSERYYKSKQHFQQNIWCYILFIIVIMLQIIITFNSAPYYLTHYNRLAGGNKVAQSTLLVGWGEGLDLAANYLNSIPQAKAIKVSSWYHSAFEPFFTGQAIEKAGDEKISRSPKPALASDYTVLYINQIQRQMPTPGMIQYYQSFEPEHIVTINGINYAYIYPSPAMVHTLAGEVRLVGQAELLGYNLLNEQSAPISQLPANSKATIQLYWEWQGKAPDEPIGLNLVDSDGRVWGWAEALGSYSPFTFEEWAEGAIVRDDFALQALPGTPPGDYFLKAWIDRPSAGERVGDFPIQLEDTHIVITRPSTPFSLDSLSLSENFSAKMAKGITLLGLSNSEQMVETWSSGEHRELVLYWQATQAINQNHPLTLALIDSNGTNYAEWVNLLVNGRFPTDQWQSGDIIRDPWMLTLPPYVPPGDYHLTAQLSDEPSIDLLSVSIEGRPRLFDAPDLDLMLNATFGEVINLLGVQTPAINQSTLEITPGQPLNLTLVWQATERINTDYTVTVQLLDAQQNVYAQKDSTPLNGVAPTTSWTIKEVLSDNITLNIPAEIGIGPHYLLVALYQVETGKRLLINNGADHLEISVSLR